MQIVEDVLQSMLVFLPLLLLILFFTLLLKAAHWLLIGRFPELGNEKKFPRQMAMMGLSLVSLLGVVIALPINESFRNQIIGLIGIAISGVIAFSSTNIVSNLMSGILLRLTNPFRTGDFIRVGDYFGRVSERGLFDTELQSETRELIAIPNSYLISHPVSAIRSSGAIISITLSLGYDVHHSEIEPLLLKAAENSGLNDPFVHIIELGDFSISYRISGLLTEVKWLISARSNLSRCVLEELHTHDIEIMSPKIVASRKLDDDQRAIPKASRRVSQLVSADAEEIVFDKAEEAERMEGEKLTLKDNVKRIEAELKEAGKLQKDDLKQELEATRSQLKELDGEGKSPSEPVIEESSVDKKA
ncbi:mechanosensitive ion channel [Alteromonadaceae bacterium BrNp21-10]|nr:mechanosensitive ion channel [Alteromonadaceae bacterium BrNp21-10]